MRNLKKFSDRAQVGRLSKRPFSAVELMNEWHFARKTESNQSLPAFTTTRLLQPSKNKLRNTLLNANTQPSLDAVNHFVRDPLMTVLGCLLDGINRQSTVLCHATRRLHDEREELSLPCLCLGLVLVALALISRLSNSQRSWLINKTNNKRTNEF